MAHFARRGFQLSVPKCEYRVVIGLAPISVICVQRGLSGEVFAQGLRGGVFSWSYYGTSDGIEANTRDTYTEHVMRCQWGRTADAMQSWMVARRCEHCRRRRDILCNNLCSSRILWAEATLATSWLPRIISRTSCNGGIYQSMKY